MRHVGDVHPQSPATLGENFQRDRVVEVAGVGRVDRDDRQRGQVLPVPEHLIVETRHDVSSRLEYLLGELLGQTVLVDDRLLINTRRVTLPEHLDNHSLTSPIRLGKLQHLQHNLVTGPGTRCAPISHLDRIIKQPAVDPDPAPFVPLEVTPHEASRQPLEHRHHLAAPTASPTSTPRHADPDNVPVDRTSHVRGRNEQLGRWLPAPPAAAAAAAANRRQTEETGSPGRPLHRTLEDRRST